MGCSTKIPIGKIKAGSICFDNNGSGEIEYWKLHKVLYRLKQAEHK